MRSQAIALCLLDFLLCAAFGQVPAQPRPVPLQAELIKHAHVHNLAKGDTIFARVTVDWNGPGCVLRRGAILDSQVQAVQPHKGRSPSTLALSFNRAQCNGSEMAPMKLVLVAVAQAPSAVEVVPGIQFTTASVNFGTGAVSPGGVSDMNIPRLELSTVAHQFPMKKNLQIGDVIGIHGMKLAVGVGPERSSVLSSRGDVSLSAYTQMLMVPESEVFNPSLLGAAAERGMAPKLAADAPAAEALPKAAAAERTLNVCAPPGCTVDLPVTAQELQGHSPSSISARALGYKPRLRRVLDDFNYDEAVAWLGTDRLLFAFNHHPLIRRIRGHDDTERVIRAVLLDARKKTVIRSLDWEIPDSGCFLWQLRASQILVHVGDELRVYGDGLDVLRTMPLRGPLAFVRTSTNGDVITVATLRERHSTELHSKLREELGTEPEEDVDVRVLDKNFDVIATATTVSNITPPTLLNEGQVILLSQPDLSYRLAIHRWENTSGTLARFESLCAPRLTIVGPDLLFLVSCDLRNGEGEFRLLRKDGKLMLRGNTSSVQAGVEAVGNARVFAVKVVTADRDIPPGASFTAGNLQTEELRVYRAMDSKRLLTVRVNDPPTSRSSFAVSPDGTSVAVLSGTEIKVFLISSE